MGVRRRKRKGWKGEGGGGETSKRERERLEDRGGGVRPACVKMLYGLRKTYTT
jgi:hypothetical protein